MLVCECFFLTGVSASDQWLNLGSELTWESPPGCITSGDTCSAESGFSISNIGSFNINGTRFKKGLVVNRPVV